MIAEIKLKMVAPKSEFVVINSKKIQAPGAKAKRGHGRTTKTANT
jgi:hypothetical protein